MLFVFIYIYIYMYIRTANELAPGPDCGFKDAQASAQLLLLLLRLALVLVLVLLLLLLVLLLLFLLVLLLCLLLLLLVVWLLLRPPQVSFLPLSGFSGGSCCFLCRDPTWSSNIFHWCQAIESHSDETTKLRNRQTNKGGSGVWEGGRGRGALGREFRGSGVQGCGVCMYVCMYE